MTQHYCPDCQSVCNCDLLELADCTHACAEEDAPVRKRRWPWDKPEMQEEAEGWPC